MPRGAPAGAAALAVLGAALAAAPAVAQERADADERECRCVDAQGAEIDRCRCIVLPDRDVVEGWAGRLEEIAERIAARPFGRRARLGVSVREDQPVEHDQRGARVYDVDPESAAAEAGLRTGDVITHLDGRSLLDSLADAGTEAGLDEDRSPPVQRLLALLEEHEPGDRVEVGYLREGEARTSVVELREGPFLAGRRLALARPFRMGMPRMAPVWGAGADCPSASGERSQPPVIGLGRSCAGGAELLELNEGLAEYFQAEAGDVVVVDAGADHPLGLGAGDVLLTVGGRDVQDLEHALGMLRSYRDDEPVRVRVLRAGETLELEGTLG